MEFFSAIVLDRDGTVIEDRHYLHEPEGVKLLPGVADTLSYFSSQGVRLFLASNQSGVGRGMFALDDVHQCNARLAELLKEASVVLTDAVFCPHHPEAACTCRKPRIGLWRKLKQNSGLKGANTLMVGDKSTDLAFAFRAGVRAAALLLTGKGEETAKTLGLEPLPDSSAACAEEGGVLSGPGYRCFPDEKREGYPHLVAADWPAFKQAVMALDRYLAS